MYMYSKCLGKYTYLWYLYYMCTRRALSDFDGDFAPEFGTEDSPAEICPDNSSLSPIALKIGLKVAGTVPASFEPTFMAIGKILDLSDKISAGGNIWGRF